MDSNPGQDPFEPAAAQTGWRDHLVGLVLAGIYLSLLVTTSADLAMARDEGFYVIAGTDYSGWFDAALEGSDQIYEDGFRDAAWDYNHEHPGLVKSLFALSWLAEEHHEVFGSHTLAFRFPGMLSGALMLWLLYIFGAQVFGRKAGLFGALLFALIPRVFYHSHLACFDMPIVLAVTFCVYTYWRSLRSRWWGVMAGVAFGLALSTKHNSWALPGIFLIHFVWMSIRHRADEKRGKRVASNVRQGPWWMISYAVLGPPIFVLTWPWLWSDQILERIGFYIRFHVSHVHYSIAYFGDTLFAPPFPIELPFVLTAFTVPFVTIALALVGLGLRFGAFVPAKVARVFTHRARPDDVSTAILLVGSMLAPLVVIALPSSPVFGGTKHWFPAYPPLCMFAGYAFASLTDQAMFLLRGFDRKSRRVLVSTFGCLLLAPGLLETAHAHPFGLSHYTPLAGGIQGAADLGMNRQFWGFTSAPLNEFFQEELPNGGTVFLADMVPTAWSMLHRDGLVPQNIRGTMSYAHADLIMIHHERHFSHLEHQAWVRFQDTAPARVLTYDGVPIITVYRNPNSRRTR